MSSAFVGGGETWAIEVLLPKGQSEYWISLWAMWNREAPKKRIWRVTYGRVTSSETQQLKAPKLTEARDELHGALKVVKAFYDR